MIYFIAVAVYVLAVWIGYHFGRESGRAECELIVEKLLKDWRTP